ncbi:GntR family transcriptional regulator [Granulicella arctica]|uniref:DNA-binding transcriptional regulator YhcF (GntR family) n=1 Tax=Granulicella arctica TaxID=940613 RepID=A0A7Y9TFV8_9BACT|nr:DNA-binding transcriptional regulator YhcF (GntR family) [Granulicella arctica]
MTQITMGILSQELAAGERLPSTRELARRFHLHANTVSGAYQQLEAEGWVESRRGSGVFVRSIRPELRSGSGPSGFPRREQAMEYLLSGLVQSAQSLGISRVALRQHLHEWLEVQQPDRYLLLEPDAALRRIVIAEIEQATGQLGSMPVSGCALDDPGLAEALSGALVLALPSKAQAVRAALPAGVEVMTLEICSLTSALAALLPAPTDSLVGVASPWAQFREVARIMLVAAGFHPDSLVFRDCLEPGWCHGLGEVAAVVCDTFTATQLPVGIKKVPFTLLAEESLAALQRHAQGIGSL